MLIRRSSDIPSSEITSETIYLRRRELMRAAAVGGALAALSPLSAWAAAPTLAKLDFRAASATGMADGFFTDEAKTPERDVTHYNNFYEFGLDKGDAAARSGKFQPQPWKVLIDGEVERPGEYDLDELLRGVALEERIYRLRCVEAWSMVVPWIGFPLSTLIERVGYTSKARYVAFTTVMRPEQMPGQKALTRVIDWPYVEGLRIDEAMHPLTLLSVGLYGKVLPAQNGAPIRLVVPWKYGFKSIKSIVRITLQEQQPKTSWSQIAPDEYGFYANVNPQVDHPRWSQKSERRLPGTLFNPNRIPTQMFNGYGEQVAHLYKGMDLRSSF